MKRFEFSLNISPDEYLDYYRGSVKSVVVHLNGGTKVQFPASLLRRHVSAGGIRGEFILTCDDDFANAELKRKPPRP